MTSISEQAAEIAEAISPEIFSRFMSEPRESLADRVAARKWATEYLSEQIAFALRAVARDTARDTWEEAAKVAFPAHATAIDEHGNDNAANQYVLRRKLAAECRKRKEMI